MTGAAAGVGQRGRAWGSNQLGLICCAWAGNMGTDACMQSTCRHTWHGVRGFDVGRRRLGLGWRPGWGSADLASGPHGLEVHVVSQLAGAAGEVAAGGHVAKLHAHRLEEQLHLSEAVGREGAACAVLDVSKGGVGWGAAPGIGVLGRQA